MQHSKLGCGTYILREEANIDLHSVLKALSGIGYEGVEFVGLFGCSAGEIRSMLDELNIAAIGDHVPVHDFFMDSQRIFDDHLLMGCRYITLASSPDDAQKRDGEAEDIYRLFSDAARAIRRAGMTPLYHNHDFDMRGDAPFVQRLLDAVPDLSFEPDVGWMLFAKKDPIRFLRAYKDRCPVIHLKDFCFENLEEQTGIVFKPTGYGIVNTPAMISDCMACHPEWLMVDHDCAYNRSSYQDLKISYEFVKNLLSIL